MPVTRHELRKQYEQNHKSATEALVQSTFHSICDEVTICNNYGNTTYKMDFSYRAYWTQPLVDRVVEKLKTHYTDTHIYSCDKVIYMTWTFMDHFADKTNMVTNSSDAENVDDKRLSASSLLTQKVASLPDEFGDASLRNSTPVVDLNCDEKNENIQINITLPPRVTRSSTRKP